MNKLIKSVLALAEVEAKKKVREYNNNSGRRVQEYQAATTLGGTHWPWCAAFCAWLLQEAGEINRTKVRYCYSASCDVVLAWARSLDLDHRQPQVGDFGLVMASKYDATHIFLVVGIDGDEILTIEGNTNDGGSREGIGVFKRRRAKDGYTYVRWIDAQPAEESEAPKTSVARIGDNKVPLLRIGKVLYVPLRKWGKALGLEVHWDEKSQSISLGGRIVPMQSVLHNGEAHVPLRKLCEDFHGTLQPVYGEDGNVTVKRV